MTISEITVNCIRTNEHFYAPYDVAKNFGRNQKNRPIKRAHVKDFLKELERMKDAFANNHNLAAFNVIPIIVNNITGNVLDGQHKLSAYLKAIETGIIPSEIKICVGFYECSLEEEPSVIIKLNEKSRNWTLQDFVGFYWFDGNENYKILLQFAKNHPLCCEGKTPCDGIVKIGKDGWPIMNGLKLRYAACFLKLSSQDKILKSGDFKVSNEEIRRANIVYEEIIQILNTVYKDAKLDASVESLIVLWADYRDNTTLDRVLTFLKDDSNHAANTIRTNKDKKIVENMWKLAFKS